MFFSHRNEIVTVQIGGPPLEGIGSPVLTEECPQAFLYLDVGLKKSFPPLEWGLCSTPSQSGISR